MSSGTIAAVLILMALAFYAGYQYAQRSLPTGVAVVSQPQCSIRVINDRDYYPTLLDYISRANKSIYIAMFQFKSDTDVISKIVELLISKNKKGVDVKVVLENTIDENELTYRRLLDNGVAVKFDSRSVTTHAKLVIIDGRYVFVGSHNWSYMAMMRNHEASVLIDCPSIAEQETQYFMNIYRGG
ncbi:phospholipase D/Transphosphatidylase [Thermofilum pendens Hrk 5]|uniref:Phospholipase D/Transphosphatidylase n=1 Tax=Thermofilum pendens (strain DSM 2475 / Hrk 5) TaxID=368408 RepID=A1RYZ7_THEPD|nr:phospholipase D/Transphosphatidylase [Thermofilum pendens Hrk 5]